MLYSEILYSCQGKDKKKKKYIFDEHWIEQYAINDGMQEKLIAGIQKKTVEYKKNWCSQKYMFSGEWLKKKK